MPHHKAPSKPLSIGNFAEIGLRFGFIIAIPLLAFILLGMWLDEQLGSTPLCIILGVLLALALSTYLLYREIIRIFGRFNL